MNVYDVLISAPDIGEIIKHCVRNLRGAKRKSAREWLEHITASLSMLDAKPSFYTMLAVVCPDEVCRVFAVDTCHIDVSLYKKVVSKIPDIPDLQDMSYQELLGMEVSPLNILDVGPAAFIEALFRAILPGVSIAAYWTPRCARDLFNAELKNRIKHVLAQYNDAHLRI